MSILTLVFVFLLILSFFTVIASAFMTKQNLPLHGVVAIIAGYLLFDLIDSKMGPSPQYAVNVAKEASKTATEASETAKMAKEELTTIRKNVEEAMKKKENSDKLLIKQKQKEEKPH